MPSFAHAAAGYLCAAVARKDLAVALRFKKWEFCAVSIAAAYAPDFDTLSEGLFRLFSVQGGAAYNLLGHRGITHSIVGVIIWAALFATGLCLIKAASKPNRSAWNALFLYFLVAAGSHLVLDGCNDGTGIPLLAPFTLQRFQWPIPFLADASMDILFQAQFLHRSALHHMLRVFCTELTLLPPLMLGGLAYDFFRQRLFRIEVPSGLSAESQV